MYEVARLQYTIEPADENFKKQQRRQSPRVLAITQIARNKANHQLTRSRRRDTDVRAPPQHYR
jgi:c-di-GMP-binding flagellar brake protein YcgR